MGRKENSLFNLLRKKLSFNPVGYEKPDARDHTMLWTIYDVQQNGNFLKWTGDLPKGLTSQLINRMLYWRGSLCAFKLGDIVYILPYTIVYGLNAYGMPTKVRPVTFSGQYGVENDRYFLGYKTLDVDFTGENGDEGAVLLFDSIPIFNNDKPIPRAFLNQIILNEMGQTSSKINQNVSVSNKKVLIKAKDRKQADVIRNELSQIFDDESPYDVIFDEYDATALASPANFFADKLFNILKNWNAMRCFMNGIPSKTFGEEKKERVITDELEGDVEQVESISSLRLQYAKEFCSLVNKKFGLNIDVKLTYSNKEEEEQTEENEVKNGGDI